jgi:hypothetical protein
MANQTANSKSAFEVCSSFQELTAFFSNFLLRIGNIAILTLAMSHPSQDRTPGRRMSAEFRARNGDIRRYGHVEEGAKEFFGLGGQCKSLKSLESAKEIQGKPSLFL